MDIAELVSGLDAKYQAVLPYVNHAADMIKHNSEVAREVNQNLLSYAQNYLQNGTQIENVLYGGLCAFVLVIGLGTAVTYLLNKKSENNTKNQMDIMDRHMDRTGINPIHKRPF
jgi:hypothetical protein